jgi:2,5-diamino-6-(ribosylamino)-4(3H)-pyrimidinone 5'-phosphate reductase
MNRPYNTLFLLQSVDGKISTGDSDNLDIDQDYKNIVGLKEGKQQYHDIEQETDLYSLNTGRVFAKIGVNEATDEPEKLPVSFIVIDNKPHLTGKGVTYLAKKADKLFIVTTETSHPAITLKDTLANIEIISYSNKIDFKDLMSTLKEKYGIERITIQSGGTLNTTFVREGLIDRLLLVIAPALIGGKDTSTLMDGHSLHNVDELSHIKTLNLIQVKQLSHSYLLLEYEVKN